MFHFVSAATLNALEPKDAAFRFWTKLLQIVDVKDSNCIDLAEIPALGDTMLPSNVYIRNDYKMIYNKMERMKPATRFIIRGTPGIGKLEVNISVFIENFLISLDVF